MNDYPRISDIIDALKRLNARPGSDRAKARDKLLDRLHSLRFMLPGLDVQRSRNFCKLMEKSVILDVSDVKDVALPVLFTLFVTLLREAYRSEIPTEFSRMLVLEEFHSIAGGQIDKRTSDLREGKPSSFLRDLRKAGGGTFAVVISQLLPDIVRSVRGNLGSVICLRQGQRDDIREAGAALNLTPWQEDELAKLPNRHAIARFSRYGQPFYLAAKDARDLFGQGPPPPSREEARARSQPVLEAIPYVRRSGPALAGKGSGSPSAGEGEGLPLAGEGGGVPTAAGSGLNPVEAKVFARIAERPWELIQDRMDGLGLDRETEGDTRAKLESRGLISFAGKVGAKCRLFQLTPRGKEFAEARGLAVAGTGKGSALHESIVRYTQRSLGRHSADLRFQRTGISPSAGGVQPDLLLLLPGGSRIPIQASFGNQPGYEAAALLRLCKLSQLGPGDADRVDFVLEVAVNKHHRDAIDRALKSQNGGSLPSRLALLDFDMVIDQKFDWNSVFEFQF